MVNDCPIELLSDLHWFLGFYLSIGAFFALAGLGIALATCNHKHDLLHVSCHIQATIVDAITWPIRVWQIALLAHRRMLEKLK